MLVGQNNEARRSLIEFFEQRKPEAEGNTKTAARRRNRILADAADRLADIYAMDSQTDGGLEFFQGLFRKTPGWKCIVIEVVPLPAPDEAVLFEDGDDLLRQAVAVKMRPPCGRQYQ